MARQDDGPLAVAIVATIAAGLLALWAGVDRLEAREPGRAMPGQAAMHLGGERWVPAGEPVPMPNASMRLVARSNEGYHVFAAGDRGGGGGWAPPTAVAPARERLFLSAPGGRWLPMRREPKGR